ncbi:acyl carrier protein [Pseudomonas zeae]|uniref:Acyl carrier protein n=1 Tax=Pseudomonas zeae TaxID=2745510 RepID=A0ABU5BRR1_9PSED|nr:acyl carrier protein [Pseudomonas zeae]MDX9679175.1 acyl carrier protein [Pseudomonas zeae]
MDDLERLKKIVIQFGIDEKEIKNESSFIGDLGMDDLKKLELVMAIEDEFGMEIPEQASEKFTTVQDVINYVSVHKLV